MGLTIHARGKMDRIEDIPLLIAEIEEISRKNDWEYDILDDDFDTPAEIEKTGGFENPPVRIDGTLGLKGVVVNVGAGVESVGILFDRSGVLTGIGQQISWLLGNKEETRYSTCKTQFGDVDSHISVIKLFDILKNKYMDNLEVFDEGSYWTDRDRECLAERLAVTGHFIRDKEKKLGGIEISEDDDRSPEAIASRVETALIDPDKKDATMH